MSQQEDDLRALAKIMDLLRGLSILVNGHKYLLVLSRPHREWQFHPQTMKILHGLDDAGKLFTTLGMPSGGLCYFLPFRALARRVSRMKKYNGTRYG